MGWFDGSAGGIFLFWERGVGGGGVGEGGGVYVIYDMYVFMFYHEICELWFFMIYHEIDEPW